MKLVNYMEVSVEHFLPNLLLAFPNICKCELCLLDIKAIALNNLKPHYVVTEKGELYTKLDEMKVQFETDILKALIEAISVVSKHPRHKV
ncbi:late competence development ComFB family protein [Helicovermis profundi]|uniref:Competence protein ComFB n=1 Tax=Helicovermis profundi TaxID=3065157 RepID=A0AAU9E3M6_9FIRM|nr:hypothetical protein HLPR_13190 [Clostridia bacterium S502]